MTERGERHLDDGRIQALLDDELSPREGRRVREHLHTCARCRTEVRAWEELYLELGDLPALDPRAGFADRVLEALPSPAPEPQPLLARARDWLAGLVGAGQGHLAPGWLQQLVEGSLEAEEMVRAEQHLEECTACREELGGWRTLLVHLDELPRFTPSEDFAERVMAHVRVHNMALAFQPSRRERIAEWIRDRIPSTGKSWAALLGVGVTPAVLVGMVAHAVFSHPLATVGNVTSFFWLKGTDMIGQIVSAWLGGLVDSSLVVRLVSAFELLAHSPTAAASAITLASGLTMAAAWVLYRNLIATEPVDRSYAHSTL